MFIAFDAGADYFDRTVCNAPGMDGDCDAGIAGGLAWAEITLLVGLVAVVVSEVVIWRRRNQAHSGGG